MAKNRANQAADLRFDWNMMQTFLAVIDQGSLQGAARALSQSQPTMGRHIEQLEAQLNIALFERTGRALMPTDSARQLASVARSMQSGADAVSRMAQQQDQALEGTVRISASRMVTNHLLADIVLRMQQSAPELDIAVVSTDAVSNLLRRDADIAIRMIKPSQSDVIAKRLGHIAILPCASQSYIDRWGAPRNIVDLFNHRLIGADKDRTFLDGMATIAKQVGREPGTIRLAYRTDDFVAQAAAVKAGIGIGFVAQHLVQQNKDMVALQLNIPIPPLPLWLAVHREIRTILMLCFPSMRWPENSERKNTSHMRWPM